MTALESRPQATVVKQLVDQRRRPRKWMVSVLALTVALIGLAAWMAYDRMNQESVPAEIEELLDGYLAAFNNQDEAAFLDAVTEDYLLNEFIYLKYTNGDRTGAYLNERVEDADIDRITTVALQVEWQVEQVGEAIVAGDGPWFVSVGEDWTYEESLQLRGMASYVVVEREGGLKIDNHSWAGLMTSSG